MRRIIRRMFRDTLLYSCNRIAVIINPIGGHWFRPLCRKLLHIVQRLRKWGIGVRPRHASIEMEGLGSTYDKHKWSEAYYAKPDKAMAGYPEKDMNNS